MLLLTCRKIYQIIDFAEEKKPSFSQHTLKEEIVSGIWFHESKLTLSSKTIARRTVKTIVNFIAIL